MWRKIFSASKKSLQSSKNSSRACLRRKRLSSGLIPTFLRSVQNLKNTTMKVSSSSVRSFLTSTKSRRSLLKKLQMRPRKRPASFLRASKGISVRRISRLLPGHKLSKMLHSLSFQNLPKHEKILSSKSWMTRPDSLQIRLILKSLHPRKPEMPKLPKLSRNSDRSFLLSLKILEMMSQNSARMQCRKSMLLRLMLMTASQDSARSQIRKSTVCRLVLRQMYQN